MTVSVEGWQSVRGQWGSWESVRLKIVWLVVLPTPNRGGCWYVALREQGR
jgi:hypothetical protein